MADTNTKDFPDDTILLRCMQEMVLYLPALEDPDFVPGEFTPTEETNFGSVVMPYVIFGNVAEAFISAGYERGWVLRGFDWVSWKTSDDAQALCSDPSALARAEPVQLLQLITALIQQDRFMEGTLLRAFKSRLILSIVRRTATIIAV